jgi:hypothetical protein
VLQQLRIGFVVVDVVVGVEVGCDNGTSGHGAAIRGPASSSRLHTTADEGWSEGC